MPDDCLTIQGNAWYDGHLHLEYSCEPNIGHREAVRLPRMKQADGLLAVGLLKTHMDASSYDDLQEMFAEFEMGTVIEFSTYSRKVGVLLLNTVIWEVRGY